MAHENSSPHKDSQTQVFSEREFDNEVGAWPAPRKVTKVEDS